MLVSYCNCEKMGHVPSVARGCHTNYNGSLNTTIAGDIDDIIYTTHPHIVILCILTKYVYIVYKCVFRNLHDIFIPAL